MAGDSRALDGVVPWPSGEPPTESKLDELVREAEELATREQLEEFLEAQEIGEDSEHIIVRQEDIDRGKFDLDRLFQFGDALFEHRFRLLDGYGDSSDTRQRRVHSGSRGGLDGFSCADCHSVGGADGAGAGNQNTYLLGDGRRISSAMVRNPPHLLGVGLTQKIASDMSRTLERQRDAGLRRARESGEDVVVALTARGVQFGTLTASVDGTVNTSGVYGVDPDLVVKPFGWKGNFATLRRFLEDAARIHFGVQSHALALRQKDQPDAGGVAQGGAWWDPDGDGKSRELEEGSVTATAVYLAMLEAPIIVPPTEQTQRDRWARGSELFERIGCSSCHRPELALGTTWWEERSDTTDGPPVKIWLLRDGDHPKGSGHVRLFSDLKRHPMGEDLADPRAGEHGLPADVFLTRPLWGLADTAPYLHDGRAATIPDAILWHGGAASAVRDAFLELPVASQADLHLFLLSLSRSPKPRVAR